MPEKKRLSTKAGAVPSANLLLTALLCGATLFAYSPALQGGLLWDDDAHVTSAQLQSLAGLWRIWSDLRAVPQYYPLLHSAFWLEHRIWGSAVLGYHLTNVALHAISAFLLVLVLKRLAVPGAWLAGFVFALHPVHVEGVAWISEQKTALSAVFYFAAALAYLEFDRSRRKSQYLAASGLFLLALLSKTVTATLPAVLLVIFWWRRGRLSWKKDVIPLVPWFVVGGGSGIFTAWVERTLIGAQGTDFVLSFPQRLLLSGRVLCFYLIKAFWPVNLIFTYPHWTVDTRVWWQYLFPAAVIALTILLVVVARRNRGPLAGYLIFAGTLFPVLGFLNVYPFRYSYVADHFQYLAMAGIIVPVTAALAAAAQRRSMPNQWRLAAAAIFVALLGSLSWSQSRMYTDAETLHRETIARNPQSWMAYTNLGTILAQAGQYPEALEEFQAALRVKPASEEAHTGVGSVLAHLDGKLDEAMAEYHTALRINPNYAEAHAGLGVALSHISGRLPDAIAEYQAALRTQPDLALAHMNLGNLYLQTGRPQDAMEQYRAAVRLEPDYAPGYYNLGSALAQLPGRQAEAVAEFQEALRINPGMDAARQAIEILQTAPRSTP